MFCMLLPVIALLSTASAQLLSGCPVDWVSYEDHCYQFVFSDTRVYREALQACWVQGSALVSVNSIREYEFISNWLGSHAANRQSNWYTSGTWKDGMIKWNGDGTYTNINDTSGYHMTRSQYNIVDKKIVYRYSGMDRKYEWARSWEALQYNYICEIPKSEITMLLVQKRGFDYGTPATQESMIEKGPRFIINPETIVVTAQVSEVAIECVASGNPVPTYTWKKKGGNEITSQTSPRYTLSNGRLAFAQPNSTIDQGEFHCFAENKFGSIISDYASIQFGYLGDFSPVKPGDVDARLYQGTVLHCFPPAYNPAVTTQWYKETIFKFLRPELMHYFFISSNGNLYFSEVQQYDEGNYFCVVTLIGSEGNKLATTQPPSKTSLGIRLKVKGEASINYGPDIQDDFINVFPRPPLLGQTVLLECFAYGQLPLKYTWTRAEGPLPEGKVFKYDDRVLIIPNARAEHEGNYTCTVTAETTGNTASRSYYLILEAKPTFLFQMGDIHADQNSQITWRCEAQAKPKPIYTWYKDSKPLLPIPNKMNIRENVLTIHNVQKSDAGMYQCGASNTHGTRFTSGQLRVLSFKPSFVKYPIPKDIPAALGGNVSIPCRPEAAPYPDFTWHHGGSVVTPDSSRIFIDFDGTLRITSAQLSDRGTYTCTASNVNGESKDSGILNVQKSTVLIREPTFTEVTVNETTFLYCLASYDSSQYDVIYLWKFNGRLLDIRDSRYFHMERDENINGLRLFNAQFIHTGEYECSAQSPLGAVSASARLQVNGPPGEPAGVHIKRNSQSGRSVILRWTWSQLANHGAPVTHFMLQGRTTYNRTWASLYNVTETETATQEDPDKREYQLTNLLPYNNYTFRVLAVNAFGIGIPSAESTQVRIARGSPVRAPTNVVGGGGSVGVLTINWQALGRSEEAGPGFGYYVYFKRPNENSWVMKDAGNTTSFTTTVGAQNYYLIYQAIVGAYNGKGVKNDHIRYGPNSTTAEVYSAEGMPTAMVRNVGGYEINGTAIMVIWDQVPNNRETAKGKIIGYEIDYYDAYDPNGVSNSVNMYCQSEVCNSWIVIGLVPNSNYWFNVEVITSGGTGLASEQAMVTTYESPPGRYPVEVKVHSHGPSSVKVTWRGVSTILGEASLDGYKIRWYKDQDDIRSANETLVGKETEVILYGIQRDTMYKLRVNGHNRGGDGQKSPTVYFTLGGTVAYDYTTTDVLNGVTRNSARVLSLALVILAHFL